MTHQVSKLYTVTRQDIAPGYQLAQSGHSIAQFFIDHPDLAKEWDNNYLISLSTHDEKSLIKLLEKLISIGVKVSAFQEPDLNNQITAISFRGCKNSSRLVSSLPLALKTK